MKMIIFTLITLIIFSCSESKENLSIGDNAPNFTLIDSKNRAYTLSDYKGKSPVIIYFYPKANTSGCTKQACGIRDDYSKFVDKGIKIFGVSVDTMEDINKFINEYDLNFPLLSDKNKDVAIKYGVLNKTGVAERTTFIVDKQGKLAHIIQNVNVEIHSDQVFELAKNLL